MSDFVIEAEPRAIVGKKVKRLRAQGLVPVTVYGPRIEPISLQIKERALDSTLRRAGGTNLIDVKVNGDTHTVLAREVQRDVLKGNILHVDFFAVDENSKIRANIPIQLINNSPIVVGRQGILLTGTSTVTVEMLPKNLMNQIEVDLSQLVELGDTILVSDLNLGEDVTVHNDPNEMVARVVQTSAARAEEMDLIEAEGQEEEFDEEGSAAGDVEVISRGKEKEEEEDF